MRLLSMVCGLLLNAIALGSASQQSPQPEHLAPDVLALEREIESAVVRRDRKFLESALANDFRFTPGDAWTSGGTPSRIDDKASWLSTVDRGQFIARDVDSQNAEPHGSVALTSGRIRVRTRSENPQLRDYAIWYVRVYRQKGPTWELLSHRTVRAGL